MRAILLLPLVADHWEISLSSQSFSSWIDLQEVKWINVAPTLGLTGLFVERQTMQINTNSVTGNQVTVKWHCWLGKYFYYNAVMGPGFSHLLIAADPTSSARRRKQRRAEPELHPSSSSCILKVLRVLAFLGHFKFWMGIWNVLRCNGLGILNPKHMWKS